MSQEEKEDSNQCDSIEIVNTSSNEEDTTEVGQHDNDEEDKVKTETGESIAINKNITSY